MVGVVDSAVAFERAAGSARFIVAANAGAEPVRMELQLGDAPAGPGGHLVPIAVPGLTGISGGESRILDGLSTIELPPCGGTVMRVV